MIICNREDIKDSAMFVAPHITAKIEDNRDGGWEGAPLIERLLVMQVDDYRPADDEKWDVDAWEDRQGYIFAPATKEFWKVAYPIARGLAQHGKVTVKEWGETIELPCATVLSLKEAA